MAIIKTGWERDRRAHFDDIVEKYDIIRPEYPLELFNDIFEYFKLSKGKSALEIGAGTGKATTPFLEAGYDVTAVESLVQSNGVFFTPPKLHIGKKRVCLIIKIFLLQFFTASYF